MALVVPPMSSGFGMRYNFEQHHQEQEPHEEEQSQQMANTADKEALPGMRIEPSHHNDEVADPNVRAEQALHEQQPREGESVLQQSSTNRTELHEQHQEDVQSTDSDGFVVVPSRETQDDDAADNGDRSNNDDNSKAPETAAEATSEGEQDDSDNGDEEKEPSDAQTSETEAAEAEEEPAGTGLFSLFGNSNDNNDNTDDDEDIYGFEFNDNNDGDSNDVDNAPESQQSITFPFSTMSTTPSLGGGLSNLGNTCYMNSALQLLRSVPGLLGNLQNHDQQPPSDNDLQLREAFFKVMEQLGNDETVEPAQFKRMLDQRSSLFVGYRQQDSHEFLTTLLDLLDEDYKVKKPAVEPEASAAVDVAMGADRDATEGVTDGDNKSASNIDHDNDDGSETKSDAGSTNESNDCGNDNDANEDAEVAQSDNEQAIDQAIDQAIEDLSDDDDDDGDDTASSRNNQDYNDDHVHNTEDETPAKKLRTQESMDETIIVSGIQPSNSAADTEESESKYSQDASSTNDKLASSEMSFVPISRSGSLMDLRNDDIAELLHGDGTSIKSAINRSSTITAGSASMSFDDDDTDSLFTKATAAHSSCRLVGGRMSTSNVVLTPFSNTSNETWVKISMPGDNETSTESSSDTVDAVEDGAESDVAMEDATSSAHAATATPGSAPANTVGSDDSQEADHEAKPLSPIDQQFAMKTCVSLTCDSCKYASRHNETFLHLSLDIGSDDCNSIEDGLRKFFAPEKRELKCEKCFHESATMTTSITRMPPSMLIHLKRFIVDISPDYTSITYRKDRSSVDLPERLDMEDEHGVLAEFMAPDVTLPQQSSSRGAYEIQSIVNHIGSSASCGHYTADGMKNDAWTRFNDSYVSVLPKKAEALGEASETAYMVLYQCK